MTSIKKIEHLPKLLILSNISNNIKPIITRAYESIVLLTSIVYDKIKIIKYFTDLKVTCNHHLNKKST